MVNHEKSLKNLVVDLQERTKELNCLYTIEDSLNRSNVSLRTAFHTVINAIPPGWQYPEVCKAKLTYGERVYQSADFEETPWFLQEKILVQDKEVGELRVYYTELRPNSDSGPFLEEEVRLLKTVANRVAHFILHQNLKEVFDEFQSVQTGTKNFNVPEWRIVLDMIRKTDPNLFSSLLRKLLHQLCWKGIEEAENILKYSSLTSRKELSENDHADENKPQKINKIENYDVYIEAILKLAAEYLDEDLILALIQKWIQEDKSSELVKILENQDTTLQEIADAIRKYYHMAPEKFEVSPATIKGLRVSLLRRFFTDQLDYIRIAKEYVKLTDFYNLIDRMIFPPKSHGKLGGKSAGLFLAHHILAKTTDENNFLEDVTTPKTWYISSDGVLYFMQHNNLEEVLEQKYKEIDEVRMEYPHIVQLFKNSQFPSDFIKGLSVALDDLGERPLIVRSSSLLEDQIGAAFSGKYKSLFLANQGSKLERLEALMDAIAEVYASTFSPDPIEYRAERNLLDFHEEMGVMIQEVVGEKVGKYYLPAFAGVAFSNNEFRWSKRINREDGLVRLVAGLGTRAVDRIGDDYPILAAPGQPNLKVNITTEEAIRYSPKKLDVINLETNDFETIPIKDLLKECGDKYPGLQLIFSQVSGDMVKPINPFQVDFEKDDLIVNFNSLFSKSRFLQKIDFILKKLQTKLNNPVDIEFAATADKFYLLQCRPQSNSGELSADQIPTEVPPENILFSADQYVSNGRVPGLSHVVFVDPEAYASLPDKHSMMQVGRAVGKLNKLLPKRHFALMGPGRWGSRGDIKLGVPVTYSEINNTALLVEIAIKKGSYVPDLSFGTHFFQDLVEAKIRYLPLYPDDEGSQFNFEFFRNSENILSKLLPDYHHLEHVLRVIDVPNSTDGNIIKVYMNAEQDKALAIITNFTEEQAEEKEEIFFAEPKVSNHWRWRLKMAEKMAASIDTRKYLVKGVYVFGSTKNATATPASDIDIIVHLESNDKIEALKIWFDGWNKSLSEINYMRTGYKIDDILHIHYILDKDIEEKTDIASKINAPTDAAKPLKINK